MQPAALMHNLSRYSYLAVKEADGLMLSESATRQSDNYLVVHLDMQLPCNNVKLCQISRNPSLLFIKEGGRPDVSLSLHLYSSQIASRSKTSVPARGLLHAKI